MRRAYKKNFCIKRRTIKIWTTILESERQLKEEKYFK